MGAILTALAIGFLIVSEQPLRAAELPTPDVKPDTTRSTYNATGRLPRRRVESVLMSPRSRVTDSQRGSDWLLHSRTQERDPCDSPDATAGLRLLCLGW